MKLTAILCILFLSIGMPLSATNEKLTQKELSHKIIDSLNFIEGEFSLEEAVEDLFATRQILVEQGYDVPLLSIVFRNTFHSMELRGIFLDQEFLEDLYSLILNKEDLEYQDVSSRQLQRKEIKDLIILAKGKKKKDKEVKVPDGVAIGFCKALAGGLLCIIPSGVTQAIGSGLVVAGVTDMIKHANDPIEGGSSGNFEEDLNRRQRMTPENTSLKIPQLKRYDIICA